MYDWPDREWTSRIFKVYKYIYFEEDKKQSRQTLVHYQTVKAVKL